MGRPKRLGGYDWNLLITRINDNLDTIVELVEDLGRPELSIVARAKLKAQMIAAAYQAVRDLQVLDEIGRKAKEERVRE